MNSRITRSVLLAGKKSIHVPRPAVALQVRNYTAQLDAIIAKAKEKSGQEGGDKVSKKFPQEKGAETMDMDDPEFFGSPDQKKMFDEFIKPLIEESTAIIKENAERAAIEAEEHKKIEEELKKKEEAEKQEKKKGWFGF